CKRFAGVPNVLGAVESFWETDSGDERPYREHGAGFDRESGVGSTQRRMDPAAGAAVGFRRRVFACPIKPGEDTAGSGPADEYRRRGNEAAHRWVVSRGPRDDPGLV